MTVGSAPLPRLDAELVRRGIARSREHAVELITAGAVEVDRAVVRKPSARLPVAAEIVCNLPGRSYVSRGAEKLRGALDDLAARGLSVQGRRCLDAGASTGGFTEVLLEAGARSVIAVDVGTAQLASRLRPDPRIEVHEQTDIRTVDPARLGGPVELAVADLSFISLRLVLPALSRCTRRGGDLLVLVKPQFEVGRSRVGPGGVVREPAARASALAGVAAAAAELGLGVAGACVSRRPGAAGNVEFFLWLRGDAAPAAEADLDALAGTVP